MPSLVFVTATALVYGRYRITPPERLDASSRAAVLAPLRAALDDRDPEPCAVHAAGDTVAATVWLDGRIAMRVDGRGTDLGAATDAAARDLRAQAKLRAMPADARARARIQVDVIRGQAPLRGPLLDVVAVPGVADMLAINPGIDGVGADVAGKRVLVLPHELVGMKVVAAKRPAPALDDFAFGVDVTRITTILAVRAGASTRVSPDALFRFRTDAFVEARDHAAPPLPLVRGNPPAPPVSAQALRDAALAGGRYLVAHLGPNGRFVYEHDLVTGAQTDPVRSTTYSIPRHAGTTYFLAELYRITKEPSLREPIERAIGHLAELVTAGHCGEGTAFDCVLDHGEQVAQLGSTALAVVALAEYQRATGDARYLPLATKLAAFLLYMQRADGSFRHLYDVRTRRPDETSQLLYYSGESALALARMHAITGDARYAQAAERALDWLVDWYDFFLGGFFYGEEHWTCIAAEAIWPAVQKPKYREFCDGYAEFSRHEQPALGEHPDEDDLAGAYNLTPFVMPYNTPSGSRTEAMISTYLLDVHHGAPDPRIAGQIRRTLGYLLAQQVRPDSDFAAIGDADGGVPASPIERTVRIDYVQHVCSAMIRASEAIDSW